MSTLNITYQPPSSPKDYDGALRFHQEYVAPLGRARKNIRISPHEIIVEGNQPGMLNLAVNFLDVALTDLDELRLEPVQELNPPGGWYGDLEPKSATLLIGRVGSPMKSLSVFQYEPPPFRSDYQPPLDKSSIVELSLSSYEGNQEAVIRGTGAVLLSVARQAIYFSQTKQRGKLVYGKADGVKGDRLLVFENAVFAENVPWAKILITKKTESEVRSS